MNEETVKTNETTNKKANAKGAGRKRIYKITECAIMIALATVLSVIKLWHAPMGGSITLLSMFPIIFISVRHGIKWGMGSGFIYGVIQLLLGLDNFSYVPTFWGIVGCAVFDYLLPFTLLGLGGVFLYLKPKTVESEIAAVVCGTILAVVLRFMCHFLGGAIIWYELSKQWAEPGDYINSVGMWLYSFVYNITYLGPDGVLVIGASPMLVKLKNMSVLARKSA